MKIIECPRDAMQGISKFIPTDLKIRYLNQLLKVGFDTLDFGSFVSPKAVPQMRDTHEVLGELELEASRTRLLAIVANLRGAEEACDYQEIAYLGYPLSLSETFQQRNTNRSIEHALDNLAEIQELCELEDKSLVTYLSMGFGNPYGDPYEPELVTDFVKRLDEIGVSIISISDTIGVATPELIEDLFIKIIPAFPHIEFGAHLHSRPDLAADKVEAAFQAGCRRMDGAIRGFGGCPMADDQLVGNLATEKILTTLNNLGCSLDINKEELALSLKLSNEVFK